MANADTCTLCHRKVDPLSLMDLEEMAEQEEVYEPVAPKRPIAEPEQPEQKAERVEGDSSTCDDEAFARALHEQLNDPAAAAAALPVGVEDREVVDDDAEYARELDRELNGPQGQEIAPVFIPISLSDRQTERNSCIASAALTGALLACTIALKFLF